MSEEQLKAFLEKVKGDTSLQEKLKAATDADSVVEIAKAADFVISADDWNNAQPGIEDAELEAAAGGGAGGATTQTVECQTCNLSNPCNTNNSTCQLKHI